jgi:hypothetical protein
MATESHTYSIDFFCRATALLQKNLPSRYPAPYPATLNPSLYVLAAADAASVGAKPP